MSTHPGEWTHGLFNCFDDLGICLLAYFAPCIVFGQNAEKIGEGSCIVCVYHMLPEHGEGSCIVCGAVFFIPILNLFEWVHLRGKIREHNGIDGTTVNDCLTVFFCPVCALAQEGMEVKQIPGLMSMCRE